MMKRPSWDEYFLEIAKLVASRSTCLRRQVGAVFVRDKRMLTTGYNGAPSGLKHCEEGGCIREREGVPSGERHKRRSVRLRREPGTWRIIPPLFP